ncbi:hypothetical protein GCM10009745_71700 [Kribbella yunnanensis]|uniref:Amidohydrolase-related domain-containing protein n=1 Tax=Kribbella yunnanensis TaxID=190194 RepID=A0ABP4V0V9_9ACTN
MTTEWTLPVVDYPARVSTAVAITQVAVVPMDEERVLTDHTVVVRDGKIDRVAPAAEVDTTGMRVVDGAGKYLIPGLADMHMHLGDSTDLICARDVGELLLYLNAGVTTVRNMWGDPFHLAARARVASGELPGPRIVTASPIIDGRHPTPGGRPMVYRPVVLDDPADAVGLVKAYAERGYDLIKPYSWLSLESLQALGRASKDAGLAMSGHCPIEVTFAQAADAGMNCLEHMTNIFHGTLRDGESAGDLADADPAQVERVVATLDWDALGRLADRFAEDQIWNCPTIAIQERMPCVPQFDGDPLELIQDRLRHLAPITSTILSNHPGLRAPLAAEPEQVFAARQQRNELKLRIIRLFHERGAPLLTGSDAPIGRPGDGVHDELATFVRAGLTPYEALRCATTEPARYLGQEQDWGTITEGKRADLVLLDANPLTDIANSASIAAVFTNGYHLSKAELTALMAARAEALAAPLSALSLPEPSELLRTTIFGTTTGLLTYAHRQQSDGSWLIDERSRSHTRERTTRLDLAPDFTIRTATTRIESPLGAETTDVTWEEDKGYRVVQVDLDGVLTTAMIGEEHLVPSDSMALSVAALRLTGEGVRALAADHEAVEEHTLSVELQGSSRSVTADHPRDALLHYQVELAEEGAVDSIVATFGLGMGNRLDRETGECAQ